MRLSGRGLATAMPMAGPMPVERLLREHATEARRQERRSYKANAFIHVLAIPIFSRLDVGGGYATVEEGAGEQPVVGLQFAGGSTEARARGLNRVGLIQEAVVERSGGPTEAAYFGFMVASNEKSLDQARKSLEKDPGGSVPYAAAFGSGSMGHFRSTVSHISVPGRYNWTSFADLFRDVRTRIGHAENSAHFDVRMESAPDTFLYSVRQAILSEAPRMKRAVFYNGKRYVLQTEKQADERAGQQFAARGVTKGVRKIWRLTGTIGEAGTRQTAAFQVWYEQDDASGLPVRIEFYPKSFLRLVFEQELAAEGPKFAYLLTTRAGTISAVR